MDRKFTYAEVKALIQHQAYDREKFYDVKLIEEGDAGSSGRWTNEEWAVYRINGKHYMFSYDVGSSEYHHDSGTFEMGLQDDDEEYDGQCEVEKKQVMREEWVPINE